MACEGGNVGRAPCEVHGQAIRSPSVVVRRPLWRSRENNLGTDGARRTRTMGGYSFTPHHTTHTPLRARTLILRRDSFGGRSAQMREG